MSQTRTMSLVETVTSTAIGYSVAVATQLVVFPLFGIAASFVDNLGIAVVFTVVSIIRGYAVRRLFNYLQIR